MSAVDDTMLQLHGELKRVRPGYMDEKALAEALLMSPDDVRAALGKLQEFGLITRVWDSACGKHMYQSRMN
jgi:Mn-dependent DtxR family transcriptional regulator